MSDTAETTLDPNPDAHPDSFTVRLVVSGGAFNGDIRIGYYDANRFERWHGILEACEGRHLWHRLGAALNDPAGGPTLTNLRDTWIESIDLHSALDRIVEDRWMDATEATGDVASKPPIVRQVVGDLFGHLGNALAEYDADLVDRQVG